MRLKSILILSVLLVANVLFAQDIHYTQYNFSQLNVNPANTGNFEGTFRVFGIQRLQEFATTDLNGYSTLNLSGDYNLSVRPRGKDWISVGVNIYNDNAGSLDRKVGAYGGSLGYHIAMEKDASRFVSLGASFSGGNVQYGQSATTASTILGGQSANLIPERTSMRDLTLGIAYTVKGETSKFKMGGSVENILGKKALNPIGINIHADYYSSISEKTGWDAGTWLYYQNESLAVNLQSKFHFKPSVKNPLVLTAGLGTRTLKNVFLILGAEYGNFNVGMSYDADISGLNNANNTYKGIELGVSYKHSIYKKPVVKPVIFCPRF